MNLAQRMGFPENAKLLMIHADDAGLSHSQNMAIVETLQKGFVNSYSMMVPCPWFYEMAVFAKSNPQFDNGIHLTLTCEWENYKWGPILPVEEVSSLVDDNGHFFKKREMLRLNASAEHVKKELRAQIEKAINFGLRPSHIDSHMYSVGARPDFFQIYKDLGKEYDLPVTINKDLMEMVGLDTEANINAGDLVVEKAHFGIYEQFESGQLRAYYDGVFDDLVSGLNIIFVHPAFDDLEMKGVTVNHPNFGSEWRQIDFDCFRNKSYHDKIIDQEIKLVTWNDIKSLA